MEHEEVEAILEWMHAMREAWMVTNGAIKQLGQARGDFRTINWLEYTITPHSQAMDAAEQRLRDRLA